MSQSDLSGIRAIILAAGYSTRMGGNAKALLPLGEATMLGMAIQALTGAGVTDIRVVTGHQADQVAEEARRHGAKALLNRDVDHGMLISACVGLLDIAQPPDWPGDAPSAPKEAARNEMPTDLHEILASLTSPCAPEEKAEPPPVEAVLLMPVDAALVRAQTIAAMARAWFALSAEQRQHAVLVPIFGGHCGHPPFFGPKHILPILQWQGDGQWQDQWVWRGGLRAYLGSLLPEHVAAQFFLGRPPDPYPAPAPMTQVFSSPLAEAALNVGTREAPFIFLSVPDAGVLADLDTPQDHAKALDFLKTTRNRSAPVPEEAWERLAHSGLDASKIRHSVCVAAGALRLGMALEKNGLPADPALLVCGGLLHDIARAHTDHALAGGAMLDAQGWPECALVVAAHTVLPDSLLAALGLAVRDIPVGATAASPGREYRPGLAVPPAEGSAAPGSYAVLPPAGQYACAAVYLADKYHKGDLQVTLQERFAVVKKRFAADPEAIAAIAHRESIALAVQGWFAAKAGGPPERIIAARCRHPLEDFLKSRPGG